MTGLVEQGYDDASVDAIPLIVEYGASTRTLAAAPGSPTAPPGWRASTEPPWPPGRRTPGSSGRRSPRNAPSGRRPPVHRRHRPDLAGRQGRGVADDTVAQVGAPDVWGDGLDGTGIDVAVLDTGVDPTHPDLADQVTLTRSFVPGETVKDVNGHGTHVASTVAGTGAASDGRRRASRPAPTSHVGKVLDRRRLRRGLLDHRRHGVGAAAGRRSCQHEPRRPGAQRRHRPDGARRSTSSVRRREALFVIAAGNSGRVIGHRLARLRRTPP